MTDRSPALAEALRALPETAAPDPAIVADGGFLVFPPRAAWLTVPLDLSAAPHRIAIAVERGAAGPFDAAAPGVRLELETAAGFVPLPLSANGETLEAVFALDVPLASARLMPQGAGRLRIARFDVSPADGWDGLLPDWKIGPVRLPHTEARVLTPPRKAPLPPRPEGWATGIAIDRCDGVEIAGARIEVAAGGAMRLSFDPPIPAGRTRFEADFLTDEGGIAWVAPVLFADGAAPNAHPLARFRRRGGTRYRAEIALGAPARTLVFQPRQERGAVTVPSFTIERISPSRRAASLANTGFAIARTTLGRRVDRLVGGDPSRNGATAAILRPAGEAARRRRRQRRQGPAISDPIPLHLDRPALPPLSETPTVSIVTATRNAPQHLARYLETIAATDYPALEIVLVDNGTTDAAALSALVEAEKRGITVLRDDRPFNFAALSNYGAARSTGEVLIFANNDLEFADPSWLRAMLASLRDPAVGVAGALLHYPDGRVQHAGITLAGESRVRHTERFGPGREAGHLGRRAKVTETVAVTGALMGLPRALFETLGGFRAERYPVLYNDVDLCLRARRLGLRTVLVGTARAVHHESISIGPRQTDDPFARGGPVWRMERTVEADRFREDWAAWLDRDPCYPAVCDPLEADFLSTV